MSLKKDFSIYDVPKPIIKNHHHIQFATQQSVIKRVNSLRKVESVCPSFTPQINEMPFQIYPQRTKTQVSKHQIIQRLLDDRREKAESLRAEKVKKQESMYNYECTFHPKINVQSRKLSGKQQERAKQAHQRLYEQGLSRMKSLNQCTHLTNEEDKENCTFQPNIGKERTKDKSGLAPIYDRIQQIIGQKKQYLKRLQDQKYQNETKNKPEINYKSNALLEKKTDFKKNVLERLFSHIKEKNNRLQKLADERKDQIEKQCTFQPDINFQTDISLSGDFLERQQKEAQKVKEKLSYLKQRQQAPFQPSINKLSALLVQAERNGQSQQQKIQRLHCQPFLERKAEIQKIEEQIYKQCTFQPQINPLSKGVSIVPHSHKCACHPKEEHYHFHPEINAKSRQLAQKMKPKQQGVTVEHARLQLEYKEMKECTFRPKVLGDEYKSALQKKSVKEIPGANKYQVRIQKAKARKKEDQLFKQKLFSIQKRYVQHKQTKPQPFKLSSGQQKIPKLKQMAEEQFRKIHTFRPQTYARVR